MHYEIIEASSIEWGLLENGKPVRTWLKAQLGDNPTIEHPKVKEAIEIQRLMALAAEDTDSVGRSFFVFVKSLRNAAFYNVDFFARFSKKASNKNMKALMLQGAIGLMGAIFCGHIIYYKYPIQSLHELGAFLSFALFVLVLLSCLENFFKNL